MNNNRAKIAAYVVTMAWSAAVFAAGVQLDGALAKILSALPTIIVVGFAIFDRWVWKQPALRKLLKRPLLDGTWRGTLTSMRSDDTGIEVAHDPIPIYVTIRQTFVSISITLITQESKSRSTVAQLVEHDAGDFSVYYHYGNEPKLEFRDKSRTHAGGSVLQIAGTSPVSMSGEYWTDRRTRGTFEVERISGQHFSTWQEAESHDSEQGA